MIIVSGPPGSGKSTLAAALAERADLGVHLESDWFYRWIRAGFVPPHLPESHAQNTVVMDVVADAAGGYAVAGYLVVWDGVVGPWFLHRVVRRLAGRGVDVDYLVVRASRDEALARVAARGRGTARAGAEKMWDELSDVGEYETHVVDGDGSPADVLVAAEAALASGRLRLGPDASTGGR